MTVTSTVPLVVAGGLVTISAMSLSTSRLVTGGAPPKVTSVAPVKPLPVTLTLTPPASRPLAGLRPSTTGTAG